jgi:uncharacterized surface anchored protein
MKNKKAVELSMNVIVIAAICLIILVVSITIFTNIVGDNVNDLNENTDIVKNDYDKDEVRDFVDICPCDSGKKEYGGCSSFDEMNKKEHERSCLS